MKPILKIINISKKYADKHAIVNALNSVNLTINEGEIISLLGVNGAGKTTLSSILATLHPATSGDVLFQDASIYRHITDYRRQLGFCPQDINLDEELTVEENLLFAGRYFLMPEKEVRARTQHLLKQFNLEPYRTFDVDQLSGGYQRRLLIARALIHQPKILILDEPTVGLDPHIRRNLWDIIKELKAQGMTIILTTHYLEEAEILSDRVCILSKGEMVFVGTSTELKKLHQKETLEEVFIQFSQEQADEAKHE